MTAYIKILNGSITPLGSMTGLHWYIGTFKKISQGTLRAVSRVLNNYLTKG